MEQGERGARAAVFDRGGAGAHEGAARAGAGDQACDRLRAQGVRRRAGRGDALMAYFEPMDPAQHGAVPYRRIKRRSHRGLAVALALGVMAVSAGALWVGYRLSVGRSPSGDIPLIRAETDPVKVKPDDPGGMEIPNRDRLVFNPTGNMPVERLLPAPAAQAPAPPQTAAVSTTPPAPGAVAKGFRLQLGAERTPEIAKQEWDRIKRQHSDLLGALAVSVDRADLGARGVFYRIHVGPIADQAQAERLCAQLRQRGVGCLIAKP